LVAAFKEVDDDVEVGTVVDIRETNAFVAGVDTTNAKHKAN
jgi:enoyl-CoA hydratase/carnithine racemase